MAKFSLLFVITIGIAPLMVISKSSESKSQSESQQQVKSKSSKNEPAVYKGVTDGCKLISCSNGAFCAVRNGTAKFGNRPFENFLYPKCVNSSAEVNENSENDGNAHMEIGGPGCDQVQCSQGYQCQVRVSTVKLGNLDYAQAIGYFPTCVSASNSSLSAGDSASSVIVGGPGCDLIGSCNAGQQCMVAVGVSKYGNLPWSQFFWPFCA